jgi:hypothetical protein
MDIETLVGWGIMFAAPLLFLWRMRTQLTHLQYNKRHAVFFVSVPFIKVRVTLYGMGSVLYSLVETAGITAICFFTLHIGYVIMMPWYAWENTKYGLAGILATVLVVDATVFLMRWLKVGHSGASELVATAWVSLMTAVLTLGTAAIIFSEGKLLELLTPLQPGYFYGGVIILAGAFVVSLVALQLQGHSTRTI